MILPKKIFQSGWISFVRNKWLGIATIFIMIMTISLITSLFLMKGITDYLIKSLQDKVDISVYLKSNAEETSILKLKAELEKAPEVKEVEYLSKEKVLQNFKEKHETDNIVLQALEEIGENPLLAVLNIKANQASQYEAITNFLQENVVYQNIIDKMNYKESKAVIDKIFSIASMINLVGLVLSLVLAFVAILVAFNTIRMAIYSLREEIGIMRLVGASNWFIRGPFIVQSAIVGGIAFIISFSLILIFVFLSSPRIEAMFSGFSLLSYFISNLGIIILIQFLTGIGLGTISVFIALRRYLQV